MGEMTARALIQDMLAGKPVAGDPDMARRVGALTTLVLDLLAEVEALRQAQAGECHYRDAYRAACLLTHNSTGPTSGWEKLIERYYPTKPSADGRVWRESIMMRRLGFTPKEIEEYQREAGEAEFYT